MTTPSENPDISPKSSPSITIDEKVLILSLEQKEGGLTDNVILVKTPTCGKCKTIVEKLVAKIEENEETPETPTKEKDTDKLENKIDSSIKVFEFNPVTCRKIVENSIFKQLRSVPALIFLKKGKVEVYPNNIETWEDFLKALH